MKILLIIHLTTKVLKVKYMMYRKLLFFFTLVAFLLVYLVCVGLVI